ncbi:hypothetical protein AVEN_249161-1 [Araneus ventricosus]|uniref:Uncharacterized protein n=1 Tax=Araneus ventricosus TaxID=182803 RepID=A0A4Y2D5Q7_ARAVE|nr:hypothetical protein AVEN_249161-1 [Araneus ventricosus]
MKLSSNRSVFWNYKAGHSRSGRLKRIAPRRTCFQPINLGGSFSAPCKRYNRSLQPTVTVNLSSTVTQRPPLLYSQENPHTYPAASHLCTRGAP